MSLALLFVLAVLAAYRLSRLVTADSLFERQRNWLLLRYPPNRDWARTELDKTSGLYLRSQTVPKGRRFPRKLGQLIECPWCVGWWAAGLVWGLVWYYHGLPLPFLWWPAIGSATGAIGAMLER